MDISPSATLTPAAAPNPQRPVSVDYLFTDYGNYVGLEGLAFEEDNTLTLEFDGITLNFEFKNESCGLSLMAQVGSAGSELNSSHLLTLNLLNFSTFGDGQGSVFFDLDTGGFFWMNTIATRGLTVDVLDQEIDQALKAVRLWMKSIATILNATENESASADLGEPSIKV